MGGSGMHGHCMSHPGAEIALQCRALQCSTAYKARLKMPSHSTMLSKCSF